ncbi:hypothetical protein [Alginatibacterium sediminis]|nr:hypothetical protein [Alginatibacterium sediminis]
MKTIEVTEAIYDKLAAKVIGFGETPNSVIERLLKDVDGKSTKPTLDFYPSNDVEFKKLLLKNKKAEVALYKTNGEIEVLVWNASKLKESSNIKANIWSGYLRDWETKGIKKAEFSIYEQPEDTNKSSEHFERCEIFSAITNIPYKTLIQLEFDAEIEASEGSKCLVLTFIAGQNLGQLESNAFFDSSTNSIRVYQHETGYPL